MRLRLVLLCLTTATACSPGVTSDVSDLRASFVDVPKKAEATEVLTVTVRLLNPTESDVRWELCPRYYIAFGESGTSVNRRGDFPCDEFEGVDGEEAITFPVGIRIPASMRRFTGALHWHVEGIDGVVQANSDWIDVWGKNE